MQGVKTFLLVLAFNVGFLLVLEFGTRVFLDLNMTYDIEMTRYARVGKIASPNPLIGHVHRPGTRAKLMGVDVEINSHGFRDQEYEVAKGDAHRIVFLGDSLTFGWGVPIEDTFQARLERSLGQSRPTEIINLGIGNYNTQQQLNLFLEEGLPFSPDQIVLFYFINDAERTPRRSGWSVLENSELVSVIWSRLRIIGSMFSDAPSYEDYYRDLYRDGTPGWEATKDSFRKLKELADEQGMSLQVVLLPELHRLDVYPFAEQHAKVLAVLEGEGVEALDLAPLFADVEDPVALWVALDDAHPNAEANGLIAQYTEPFIAKGIASP